MITYKLIKDLLTGQVTCILRSDNTSIPLAPDNTDYANFKKEVLAGAELQDSEGQVMSQEEANQFIASLP